MARVLALTGFMGSGKSSVGAAVARKLGWKFIDLDTEFEKRAESKIHEFFEARGEDAFRALEAELLKQLLADQRTSNVVIALGGGSLERADSLEEVRRRGVVVLLDTDPDVAWTRVGATARPLAGSKESFVDLWAARQSRYREAAAWVLPAAEQNIEQIAAELYELANANDPLWSGFWGRKLGGTARSSLIVGGEDGRTFLRDRCSEARRETGAVFHVVSDENVMKAWGERILPFVGVDDRAGPYVLKAGESSKSVAVLEGCWDWLAERKARRKDVVLALGGGVVGDLAGFAAATYNRGVSLWQVPSTLVAQVDSSVGGKTGVNLKAGKNLVGSFYQPDLVVIDPSLLTTLPTPGFTDGLGEVAKHALLDSESAFASLERDLEAIVARDEGKLSELVRRNVFLKASVVARDEQDEGLRAVLNLGHTTAHALESSLGYGAIGHGQAVALGLVVSLAVSERLLGLDPQVRARTVALLHGVGLETAIELPAVTELMEAAARDKKVSRRSSGFVGLRAMGKPVWGLDVGEDLLAEAMEVIRA